MEGLLEKKFAEIGARVRIRIAPPPDEKSVWDKVPTSDAPRLNVFRDGKGEYFDIAFPFGVAPAALQVLDVQPRERHLLLMVKRMDARGLVNKSKFLCGYDERHWFVAAVPEKAQGVNTVKTAKEALQPGEVRERLDRAGVRPKNRLKRKNEAFVRQGEWFFVPVPDLRVDEKRVLPNEPLSRGLGSKPHIMEFSYRVGGTTVYVSPGHPGGITQEAYNRLSIEELKAGWRVMQRDATVYAKGRITHDDHATIYLPCWHRVYMNTESEAEAMRHVEFLD